MEMTNKIQCDACGTIHLFKDIKGLNPFKWSKEEISFMCIKCNHIIHVAEEAEYIYRGEHE